ncbi:MAG: hypothetical protein N3D11_14410, partial [Candidatus Sumerlaeia bacterium]|nr:hypothetical protein [Candidatus Sumerlaeia bacterium]
PADLYLFIRSRDGSFLRSVLWSGFSHLLSERVTPLAAGLEGGVEHTRTVLLQPAPPLAPGSYTAVLVVCGKSQSVSVRSHWLDWRAKHFRVE